MQKRFFLVRWFRRWLYQLVLEQEQEATMAKAWHRSFNPCICCLRLIGSEHTFCPHCGIPQVSQQLQGQQERQTSGQHKLIVPLVPPSPIPPVRPTPPQLVVPTITKEMLAAQRPGESWSATYRRIATKKGIQDE